MTNIHNLFKFVQSKHPEYPVPFKYKLLHDPNSIEEEDLIVKGDLDLSNTKITSLPNNLKVGGSLDLAYAPITSLPDNLQVGGYLYLYNTPISEKYTEEEIKQMTPRVKGKIFL